ncbi:MarR family winged helix-turn-helix transcriptional regulator [Mesorhizobium sp. L-8-10]|uniref:MarR family winged helix-turn-helix transcriptional regulator n=1 Tax=Mesorhizobium sp. L-8-10 TaxID=2744523 RepID=UPI001FD3E728|nr:MarR family winged helix-turn-helix transcriptional regulator [Mesorhizobium sp. L-8-10]
MLQDTEGEATSSTDRMTGTLPLHSSPNYLFWCLHKTSMGIVTEELEKAGADITPVQYAALVATQAHPGIDQASLANVIGYDRATIGGVVDRLERKGLLSRRVHPQDRRARALYLETAGHDLIERVEDTVSAAQARILAPLPKKDHDRFLAMVAKLIRDDLPHDVPD